MNSFSCPECGKPITTANCTTVGCKNSPSEPPPITVCITIPAEDAIRAEFERQHAGRDLSRNRFGNYRSPTIAALWKQHERTVKWMTGFVPGVGYGKWWETKQEKSS